MFLRTAALSSLRDSEFGLLALSAMVCLEIASIRNAVTCGNISLRAENRKEQNAYRATYPGGRRRS